MFLVDDQGNSGTTDVYLQMLKEPLLQEVLVRNLREGGWYRCLTSPDYILSQRGKELLKKLYTQKRLRGFPVCRSDDPATPAEWCLEALESHQHDAVNCIITSSATKINFPDDSVVTSLERVCSHPWWAGRGPSVRPLRTTQDYCQHLSKLLSCANSAMFIDPHIDPAETRYGEFWRLLKCASRLVAPVRIEIHRVCRKRDSRAQGGWRIVRPAEWESIFNTHLTPKLAGLSVHVEVFIWDDFHDRYLISDLMGISLPNGFDVSNDPNNRTTWTRLSRKDRDDIQREFSLEDGRHTLRHRFCLV